jgi:hypothetical protein
MPNAATFVADADGTRSARDVQHRRHPIFPTKSEFSFPKSNLMVRANFGPTLCGIRHLTSASKALIKLIL